jgi:hypothetical protein
LLAHGVGVGKGVESRDAGARVKRMEWLLSPDLPGAEGATRGRVAAGLMRRAASAFNPAPAGVPRRHGFGGSSCQPLPPPPPPLSP